MKMLGMPQHIIIKADNISLVKERKVNTINMPLLHIECYGLLCLYKYNFSRFGLSDRQIHIFV